MNAPALRIRDGVARGPRITFRFDGRDIDGFEGESVSAALWAAGVRELRANGAGAGPPSRTLFCAMGVCQQCAVWIEGRRVEACRVPVHAALEVGSDASLARPAPTRPVAACMNEAFDVVVLGAGPAGVAAAIEAQELGLRVAVVEENASAGGQVYRAAPGIEPQHAAHDRAEGDAMRARLAATSVDVRFGHRTWHVERAADGWRVYALGDDGSVALQAGALIVATGAQERHLPFEGWEHPGVIGLAAATVLLKSQRVLPGRRVLVAGTGPLLMVVAKGIVESGGEVVAVVDARPRRAWLADMAALASRPDLVARGAGWVVSLRRRGVRMLHGHRLQSASGDAGSLRATLVPVDGAGHSRNGAAPFALECDAICCGYGLMPATDVTRLAGAAHDYDADRGGWHVRMDADQRCSLPRLYAAGDVAGVTGAAAAPWQGRLAALAAALDLGRIDAPTHARRSAIPKRKRDRAARFGTAMTRLANIGDGAMASIAGATIMCQCEGLTRATLEAAIDDGCATLNDLKSATRCGMGPCGGRLCEDAAARLVAMRTGRPRAAVGQATGRPPLRPVGLDAIAGDFDYDALPIAAPSPL